MSGGNSTNNSWTILTSEETVAETLRPIAAGTEQREESHTSRADGPRFGEKTEPANDAGCAEGLPVENCCKTVSEETAARSGDLSSDQQSPAPTAATETPLPTSVEASGTSVRGSDEVSPEEGLPEGPAQLSPDPNLSSDSNTLVTPSPEEPPISLLSTETLGSAEFAEAEEQFTREGTLHLQYGDELQREEKEPDQYSTDLGKQAGLSEERSEKTGEQGEPEERRRRSLLAALEQIGRREDEDEEEVEEFQVPQREDDSGFSVNKCILGAVILLGLGTIFFSESDYVTRDLKDAEAAGKQDWLHPETPPPRVDADNSELLNKLSKGSEQVSVLQAQLQAQKEDLKVATGQSAEVAQERQRCEELEKENSRLKTEMASLPFLQKENDRMKRELESVLALQKELETLRSVTELKLSSAAHHAAQACEKSSTPPPTGKPEDSRQDTARSPEKQARKSWDEQREQKGPARDTHETSNKKQHSSEVDKSVWKEGGKKELKDAGKREWKKEKPEQGKEKTKEGGEKRHGDETKQWQGKDWKKERGDRGDDGKSWKVKESKNDLVQKSEKKEWKEEKDKKRGKHEKMKEDHQHGGKEDERDWKKGKDYGEGHQGRKEWKGEKEWKKGRDGLKEGGKETWERRDLKEKGDVKDWKSDNKWKHKNGKDRGKEGKGKGERKHWEDGKHGKERMENGKGERKQWNSYDSKSNNEKQDKDWKRKEDKWDQWKKEGEDWKRGERKEKRHNGDGKKDKSHAQKNKEEHKFGGHQGHKEDHLYGDRSPPHTHHRPSEEHPKYWLQQRDRLWRDPGPRRQCSSLETCAQAERLLPVSLPEFDAILQTYLSKAAEAGVDVSKREELQKLASEFFHDGVFVHDKMSFHDFVEDVGDILEDMAEGDDEEEEDSALEEEMEEFEKEVLKKFSMPGAKGKEERVKGEWRKESGAGRG
ncbi:pre-B-cell leukemia homeobox interacting protein 1b isoform 2-T2 [Xenentodon cancila]